MQRLISGLAVCMAAAPLQAQDLRAEVLRVLRNVRSIDGTGSNPAHPDWGAVDVELRRWTRPAYANGVGEPSGEDRPNPRVISNLVCSQLGDVPNGRGVSDFVWQWGQFLDHDIDETPIAVPEELFPIVVPAGDPWFDPTGNGGALISLSRSAYEFSAGVRQQLNAITACIDASQVYGSDDVRARELRTLDGTGRLETSPGGLLPFNTAGLPNAPSNSEVFFLAGDTRANEQVGLTAMHTLFVREHNYWVDEIARMFAERAESVEADAPRERNERRRRTGGNRLPAQLTGDELYEAARAIVAAEMQVITYREFLPIILGRGALSRYRGFRDRVDPSIANEFATASYRFGHTMLSPVLRRIGPNGLSIGAGDLSLQNAFFAAPQLLPQHGIEPLLRGLAAQRAQEIDTMLVDDVRNFLFGPPGSGGFDLASLNIQRGRDHGLASHNEVRADLGLVRHRSFADMTRDPQAQVRLAAAYGSVELVDPWVGGLAEDPLPGALVGETIATVLRRQFEALRDGDRFYYRNYLPDGLRRLVERQSLARIIRRNTEIGAELPDDLWYVQ